MIVDQRRKDAEHKSNPNPHRLPFNEEVNVPVTVARKSARAKKHDDPNDEQSQHCKEKDIGALTTDNLELISSMALSC